MKLTTSQLRRIIREEVSCVLKERADDDIGPDEDLVTCSRCGQRVNKDETRRDPVTKQNTCSNKKECDHLKSLFDEEY